MAKSPCILGLTEDLGCWYCKPTKKPTAASNEELRAKAAEMGVDADAAADGAEETESEGTAGE